MKNKVVQRDIKADGHVVAGDYVQVTNQAARPTFLDQVRSKLHKIGDEISDATGEIEYIDDFSHFYFYQDDKPLKSVEEKLTEGGRIDDLLVAAKCKELFTKKLNRFIFSKTAQEMYALILDCVLEYFSRRIYPLIVAGRTRDEVDAAITNEVIEDIHGQIGDIGASGLILTRQEIRGMLYFLTQKCIVNWK